MEKQRKEIFDGIAADFDSAQSAEKKGIRNSDPFF
jgi:hypothetical protein